MENDPVIFGVTPVASREGGITEETPRIIVIETDGVNIERFDIPLSKSVLHGRLLIVFWRDIVKPVYIQCPGDTPQSEAETSFDVFLVQDIDLILDLGISDTSDWNEENPDERMGQATYET